MKTKKKRRSTALFGLIPSRFQLQLYGGGRMLICGVESIRGYTPERISLLTCEGEITVTGKELLMISCFENALTVNGEILSFYFGSGGEETAV